MQLIVPAAVAVRGSVGNALPAVRPLDGIALALHQLHELLLGDCVLHGLVDLDSKLDLPALTTHGGMVLRLTDTGALLYLGLTDGQAMTDTELVREFAELGQVLFPKVELPPGLEADGVENEVRMDVVPVRVGGHDYFVVRPLRLRQLQSNLMCLSRRDRLVRMERLDEVKIHFLVALAVLQLRADEFRVAALRLAVQTSDQMAVFVLSFLCLHHIPKDSAHAAAGLTSGPVDGRHGRHSSHRPLQYLFQRLLDGAVEVPDFTEADRSDPTHVSQRRQLVQVGPLGFECSGELIETAQLDDLLSHGTGRQVLGEVHPALPGFPMDEFGVLLRHIKGQRDRL